MVQDMTTAEIGSSTEGAQSNRKTVIILSVVISLAVIIALALVIAVFICIVVHHKKRRRLTFISVNTDTEAYYTPLISSYEDIELVNIDK